MQSIHTLGIIALLVISSLIEFSIGEPRVVCYYTNWSVYRPGTAKFNPQNINPYLCTHLIYAFGGFTKDNQLKPFDKYQDIEQGGYAKFTGLKTYNKELKTMLAIGGWNEGSTRFSPLVASSERRSQLVKNAIKFLRQNKFDGLDLDWEYPAFRDGGKSKDRDNYAKLVQELREEFQREHDKTGRPRLLLTMAVPAGFEYIEKGYDVPKLNKHLDWFNILSYDYHSAYEPSVNHHAPLYPIEEENEYSYDTDLNINSTINFYVKAGADREKLVLGIPTYGRSYTLFNEDSSEIGAPADGPGEQGDATREKGYLAYYEICQSLKEEDSDWEVVQPNPDALGPYAVSGNQWVGYDDEDIVRKKSKFVVEQNLGGIMFWSIDNDDFRGLCNGKAYPLIEAAKEAYLDSLANGVPTRNAVGSSKPKQTKVATTTKRPESKPKNSGGKFTTPPPPTTPDPGSDFKCEDEGFYAHPRDCKKYFWCLEAAGLGIVAHQFTCPSGLYFNKAADSCDYSRNVHCSKAEVTSTTTEEPEVYTTTTRATSSSTSRANPLYKSPSRTTTARTTTASYDEPISDLLETDQEDPKVIKELIDLIKKVGGVEELERQLNLQEDGASVTITQKNVQGDAATTPSSIISKSLYDKIKNRASVLNKRPNFNGASQPERVLEKSSTKEAKASERKTTAAPSTEASIASKKYNSVNRFNRPSSQSAGIESIPESDAVLIEKPQYTSIRRKPAAKPAVISENDYNGDSESSSGERTTEKPQSEAQKKYASINRSRRPQVQQVVEEDVDESDEEEEIPVSTTSTTTAKPTSKYLNLSRRRSTTETPEIERTEETVDTTTTPSRRRTTSPTQKTVLNLSNRNQIQSNIQDIKDTSRKSQKETLTGNSLREEFGEDDDEADSLNVIALPTESVTENVPYPENILTTLPPPTTPPNNIQVTESLIQTESLHDIIGDASNEIDDDTTTLINDLYISESGGLSKQNEINKPEEKPISIAPRPFSRPSLIRTRSPIVNEPTSEASTSNRRDSTSSNRRETTSSSRREATTTSEREATTTSQREATTTSERQTTTKRVRTRPTVKFTTESSLADNEIESTSRAQYSYRPGYRGTAKFRTSSVRTGEYDRLQEDLKLSNFQPIENNRLRALNLENPSLRSETSPSPEVTRRRLTPRARPSTTTTTTEATIEQEETHSTRRRLTTRSRFASTSAAPIEDDEETTTEQRVVEAKNYFNLAAGERPDRIRFELAVGRKIDFGVTPAAAKTKSKGTESDPSKVKVLTGPLDKSPLVSGRDYKKGHVEEIPLTNTQTTESVTVQSFSDKLNLSEIPLNKSDIESFVADEDLRTEAAIDETTRKQRLRPSIKGFAQRTQGVIESNDEEITTQEADEETTTSRSRLRPSKLGIIQRTSTQAATTEASVVDSTPSRSRFTVGKTRFPIRGKIETVKPDEEVSVDEESTSRRTRPLAFQNRLSQRTRTTESSVDENVASELEEDNSVSEESTSRRTRPLPYQNRFSQKSKTTENSVDVEETVSSRTRPTGFKKRLPTKSEIDISSVESEDETVTARTRPSVFRNRFATKSKADDSQAENSSNEESSSVRSRPTAFKKATEKSKFAFKKLDDSNAEESTTVRVRFRPSQTKFLRVEDIKIEDVNDLQTESPLDETTLNFFNLLASAGSRFAAASSNSVEDFESYNLVTALPEKKLVGDDDDETDLTTKSNRESGEEEGEDETTLNSLIDTTSTTLRSVVIRKRPVKKLDAVATRQTITEGSTDEETSKKPEDDDEEDSEDKEKKEESDEPVVILEETAEAVVESSTQASSPARPTRKLLTRVRVTTEAQEKDSQEAPEVSKSPVTTRKRIVFTRPRQKVVEEEIRKTETSEDQSEVNLDSDKNEDEAVSVSSRGPFVRTRPTRKVLTRVRVTTEETEKDSQQLKDSQEAPAEVSSSPRTTRKRIVFTRPRQSTSTTDEGENDENRVVETSDKSVVNVDETSARTNDFASRRKVKVFKTRPSTERSAQADEPSFTRGPTTRTRVFKRPLPEGAEPKQESVGDFELKTDDESSTPRSNSRFGSDRQRKLLKIKKLVVADNEETLQPEAVDASTAAPKKRIYKVLRTKTPKLLVDRPLTDDSLIVKSEDQQQDLENDFHENDQRFDNEENSENVDEAPEEQSAKPLLRFPTRPNSANRIVTIKRRPAFSLNARTSTVHPASAKFGKEPLPTKARQVTIKRKYKPTAVSSISDSTTDDIEPEKKIALGERNKKIFSKGYRKSLSTTQAPNITPLTDTDTTEPEDDVVETTEILLDNNDENILQKDTSAKPRFSLSRFTTTTIRPTTLHHVFAIDVDEEETASKNKTTIKENNADEVIKKLQKLIEINRIVEIYSKEEKHKVLKNKKLKSIKQSDLTVERPPSIDKFGEISRETIIKLVKRNETVSTTEQPAVNQTRSPKSVVFAETVFAELESSTISLEGLFDREKKSNDDEKATTEVVSSSTHVRSPVPLLRPESNETNPIIISLKSLDKVILKKVPTPVESEPEETLTTEDPSEETTLVDDN